MYRIGIVGSDNSHADAFSKIVNIRDKSFGGFLFPDVRVTGIFGLDEERTKEVAKRGKIGFIAQNPEDLFGKVDAVMVVFRHGDLHSQYALPFIEAGIPTWIDKPFTIKNEDAKKIIEAAKKNNTLVTGGSTLKYTYDIMALKSAIENGSRIGKINSAILNFPATLENEYGGIFFYGAHLVEMTMQAFGYDVRSVIASENNGNVMAIAKYDNYQIAMDFIVGSKEYYAVVHGESGTLVREIDINGSYLRGFEVFVTMMRTQKLPIQLEDLYTTVKVLNAVSESYKTMREILI